MSNPIITIGVPVYNGERFLRKCLESLLAQTFSDFEIIISDNASTDSTHSICLEFAEKDERIQYFRQDKNIGLTPNFHFTLQKAVGKYFMWAPIDDIVLAEYVEKTINFLELNEHVVSCASDFRFYYIGKNSHEKNKQETLLQNSKHIHSFSGAYEERIDLFLKNFQTSEMYAVHRTNKFKQDFITDAFWMWDHAVALNILKHGDFHVLDDILAYRYTQGISRGTINSLSNSNLNPLKIIFLAYPFIFWCAKNLGIKVLMKHRLFFFKIFLRGEYIVISESIRIIKRIMFRQEKHW